MLSKQWIFMGAISSFFAVLLGAFGAHALKNTLSQYSWEIYHVAVQYHWVHALGLIGLGLWAAQNPSADTSLAGWAFVAGLSIFSGSLYALAITELKFLGAITPIGGVAFLVGWIAFAFQVWKA